MKAGSARLGVVSRAKNIWLRPELSGLSVEGRSRERNRRVALTAVTSGATMMVNLATPLITVPLALRYLGTEQYGLWVTITSFSALLGFSDLGLGQGLVNSVSELNAQGDKDAARRDVASAFYALSLIVVVLGLVFAAIYPAVSWPEVFNVSSLEARGLAGPSMAVLVAVTLVGVPIGIGQRVRLGFQEGYRVNAWTTLGGIGSLVGLVIVIALEAPLYWLVFAGTVGPLVGSVLNSVAVLRDRPWLRPRVRDVTTRGIRRLAGFGMLFFIVQSASLVAFQSDSLVIAQILGADAVTQFAVPAKLFMLIPAFIGLPLVPLWPAYREALERGDHEWLIRTLYRSIVLAGLVALAGATVLVVVGTPLIQFWAGNEVIASVSLLIPLGLYVLLLSVGVAVGMYFFAANHVVFLAITALSTVLVNLAVSIVLTRRVGVAGPAWGSVVGITLSLIAQLWFMRRKLQAMSPPTET